MPWRPARISKKGGSEHVINQLFRETNGRIDDLSKVSGRRVTGQSTLAHGTLTAQTCTDRTMHVTGANRNLVPHASPIISPSPNVHWSSYISAANQVTVRLCNPTGSNIIINPTEWTVVLS